MTKEINIFVAVIQHIVDVNGDKIGFMPAIKLNCVDNTDVYVTNNLGAFTWPSSPMSQDENIRVEASMNEARLAAYSAALGYSDLMNKSIRHGLDIGNFVPVSNFIRA